MAKDPTFAPPLKTMQSTGEPVVTAPPTPGAGLTLPNDGKLPTSIIPDLSSTYLTPAVAATEFSSLSHSHASSAIQIVTASASLSSVTSLMAMVRCGSSPYEFVMLVWDATYAHWVGTKEYSTRVTATANHSSTSYLDLTVNNEDYEFIPNYKAVYDAGLRPELFLGAILDSNSAGGTASFRAAIREVSDGDTALAATEVATGTAVTSLGTTGTYKVSNWTAASTTSVAKVHGVLCIQAKIDIAAQVLYSPACSARMRWIV